MLRLLSTKHDTASREKISIGCKNCIKIAQDQFNVIKSITIYLKKRTLKNTTIRFWWIFINYNETPSSMTFTSKNRDIKSSEKSHKNPTITGY